MSAASSSSLLQIRNNRLFPARSLRRDSTSVSQLAVASGVSRRTATCAARCSVKNPEKPFMGTRVRRSGGSETTLQLWRSDGPGRSPKLRTVVRSSFSGVPEKPLGLYDPSFDKDSCGVGFVAELSGETSRKTVPFL